MFKNLKLKFKIAIIMGIMAIVITISVSVVSFLNSKDSLEEAYFAQLTSIREIKKRSIEDYFVHIRNQVATFSENIMVINAMKNFKETFHATIIDENSQTFIDKKNALKGYYGKEFIPRLSKKTSKDEQIGGFMPNDVKTIEFQSKYIESNNFPVGSKQQLDRAEDDNPYNDVHEKYHPVIRDYLDKFGYYDIFLIDSETGHIVYSVFKEIDYATSLISGPYSNTNFAEVFNKAKNASNSSFVGVVDFKGYDPSYSAPAAFIASPIYDGKKKIGVLVFQLPIDKINDIMTGEE